MKHSKQMIFMRKLKVKVIKWKARNGLNILRISLGVIFIWFGALKFFHGVSAAEVLAGRTILKLSFGFIKPAVSLPVLAVWECTIGMGLITKRFLSFTLALLYFQMIGTFLPLVFFPAETFNHSVFIPTLLGQYIIKNCVLVSAGIVLGATVKGGALVSNQHAQSNIERLKAWHHARVNKKPVIQNSGV